MSVTIERDKVQRTVTLNVPKAVDETKRSGIAVSGMLVGVSDVSDSDKSVMYVHQVDRATLAQEAQIREQDIIIAIDGIETKSPADLVRAFKGKDGKDVEIMIKRERSSSRERYDYFARSMEVRDLKMVDEQGVKPVGR